MHKKVLMENLTPSQIVEELDKFIIGQHEAKRAVAIALRNRWRRQQVEHTIREEIMPNNIILIGPTGVGKTEIARRLAKLANAPFIKVEASKFTEVGYVGRDVEAMIRDLTELSVNMVTAEKKEEVFERAEQIAEEKILDVLIPPVAAPAGYNDSDTTSSTGDESLRNAKTREWMLEKLRKGELDDKVIEFDYTVPAAGMHVFGPTGMDDMGINLQEIFSTMMPKKKKKRKATIKEARRIIAQEEAEKLIDTEAAQREAIRRVQESGIVFIDEIDKVAGASGKGSGPDVSREGVQRDMLPIVEGSTVNTKYGPVKTDHILFIASGAFHVAKPSDLIPELQGRFPIRVELKSLSAEDFVEILTKPENALLKQYSALLRSENIHLEFEPDAIEQVAQIAAEVNEQVENIGARRLHTILTTLLEDILFDVPDKNKENDITISGKMVEDKLNTIVKDRDLSKYIL